MNALKYMLVVFMTYGLFGCDDTDFESTWQDPSARNLDLRREEVAAFLLSGNEAVRRSFEYNLANEMNQRGIETVPGYDLLPQVDPTDKREILARLRDSGVDSAIFMRIVNREQEVSYVPGTVWYPGPYHDPFWWYDGHYRGGFVGPWPPYYDPGYYRVDTIVSVETLVYRAPDSKLLWAGVSRTMNPSEVDEFVEDLVSEAVDEMEKTGLVRKEKKKS